MQSFEYNFTVGGNYAAEVNKMTTSTGQFTANIDGAINAVTKYAGKLAALDLISSYVEKFNGAVEGLGASGVSLDSQMHDLSAVAGVVGEDLKTIEGYARKSAKAFGTDAGVAVEGYKLLLSQLTPELAKCPEALQKMGTSIQFTSKLMANDGTAAAEVLTTAMNQYGVSLDDPIAASETMAKMMNVMAAAEQAGSAELPAIKVALEQCGMAAKAANLSFEETNAAIQVLDKAGKKGSEGGVALRNTLAILGQGRFIPKETQKELAAAGVDVLKLADTSKSLKERLEMLKPVMGDASLFSKLFGMENANAARALVQGTERLGELTAAITGTASAEEQAGIIMESYEERRARFNQRLEDMKITFFQLTGDFSMWLGVATSALVPVSQLIPLFTGVWKGMMAIKALNWASMWGSVKNGLYIARLQVAFMNKELLTGQFVSNGFVLNITRATLAVMRFATVGLWNGLKALGAFALSLVTTGTASATFSGIASAAFGAFKLAAVTACRAVSVAIMNIPIIGWVAAAIAALVAVGVYFWNTSVKFRAVLKGTWAAFKTVFTGIASLARSVFGAIGDLIKACFSLDHAGITSALTKLKGGFADYGHAVGAAFSKAYNEEMETESKEVKKDGPKGSPQTPDIVAPVIDPTGGTAGTLNSTGGSSRDSDSGSGKVRNVTINVGALVGRLEIHSQRLKEGADEMKEAVSQALLSALNDTNLATE